MGLSVRMRKHNSCVWRESQDRHDTFVRLSAARSVFAEFAQTESERKNMTATENQKRRIYDFMAAGNEITQRVASKEFDCDRLGARIWELKQDGVPVLSEFEYKLDENGKVVKKWKKYWIPRGLRKQA